MGILIKKPLVVGRLSLFSVLQNDALMHREDLKGFNIYIFSCF